jgi:hypothetical protein
MAPFHIGGPAYRPITQGFQVNFICSLGRNRPPSVARPRDSPREEESKFSICGGFHCVLRFVPGTPCLSRNAGDRSSAATFAKWSTPLPRLRDYRSSTFTLTCCGTVAGTIWRTAVLIRAAQPTGPRGSDLGLRHVRKPRCCGRRAASSYSALRSTLAC